MNRSAGIALAGIFLALAVFLGLWFMGAVSFTGQETAQTDETGREYFPEEEVWEVVYGGRRFTVDSAATVYIHESGCLNISLNSDYLIQITIEDKTTEDFWINRESKIQSMTESGYRIEREPERFLRGERDYIRYVLSMEETAGEYARTYMQVLMTPADNGTRFLICIKYDGVDVAALGEEQQLAVYDAALEEVVFLMASAVMTDEEDDETGTLWLPDISTDSERVYLTLDSQEYGDGAWEVSYHLPEQSYLIENSIMGKNYRAERENIYINVSIWEDSGKTAEEWALAHSGAGFSKIISQGEIEADGRIFYYYTYSILRSAKESKRYSYYFCSYCDLENGDVYSVSGRSYENEGAMDYIFYLDMMDIDVIEKGI